MDSPERWAVALGCMQEAYRLGQAKQIAFSFEDPVAYVTAFGAAMPAARPSMLLDYMDGRQSEVDYINGAIPVEGEKVGVSAPFNSLVTAVVRIKERKLGVR